MDKLDKFIKKAKSVHGNKYDYSKVCYVNSQTKVCIVCPEHGEFWQTPANHIRGNKCPICSNKGRGSKKRSSTEEFIEKAKSIHGDKYDYSKVEYVNSNTNVEIICSTHGSFYQKPLNHLNGQGCPKCSGKNLTTNELIDLFNKKHSNNRYDYSKVNYELMHKKVCIICPEHGEFWQTPSKHLLGQGCPKCSIKNRHKKHTTEEFIKLAKSVHGDKYDYSKTNYISAKDLCIITCKKHGDFLQCPNDHLSGHGCPRCGKGRIISNFEDELFSFVHKIDSSAEQSNRNILDDKNELDIFIPKAHLGIECDGLHWHSEEFKDKSYHLNKTIECESKGVRLIHIFEDEWITKQTIVKSIISNILLQSNNKIYARKCELKKVDKKEKAIFLNNNHIQGNVGSSIDIGLYFKGEIVSLMCFSPLRINLGLKPKDGEYELIRFCNKLGTNVIGGASKLFKHFIENNHPSKIISYSDNRWFKGDMYHNLGFKFLRNSSPNYYYVINRQRENRFKYRKDKLIKEGFDKNKSEHEIMLERKIYRIYDCGCKVWEWNG